MDDDILKIIPDQNYYQRFPALHLLRIFRIALDVRKIFLALVGLLLLWGGNLMIDQLLLQQSIRQPYHPPGLVPHLTGQMLVRPGSTFFSPTSTLDHIPLQLLHIFSMSGELLLPLKTVFAPTMQIIAGGNSWSRLAFLWSHLIWSLLIWGYFGAVLTRLAAVEFVTNARTSVREAVRFSFKNYLSYLLPAFICICAGLFFWFASVMVGLLGMIPVVGEYLLGIAWGVPLLLSFLLGLLLLGAMSGWPLSFTTVSVEGTDGFDGFSRPFSYIFSRPLRYALYVLAVLVMSMILFVFFEAFIAFVNHLAINSSLPQNKNIPIDTQNIFNQFWQHLLGWSVVAFQVSFFWSAATVVYFLMRKADDGVSLDEIYDPAKEEEATTTLPLTGVAASSHEPTAVEMSDLPRNQQQAPEENQSDKQD